ncbi:MAG: L-rhamnonate dehydratase [Chloroflexi bacterium]|nr:L-rhamnonate dehydratase [Chloroflexota bacterium]
MKIKEIRAVEVDIQPRPQTRPRPRTGESLPVVYPNARYPREGGRNAWGPHGWRRPACVVTAEDGTWGLGISMWGDPVVRIINEHYAPALIGENCMATEKIWDMMMRMSAMYGSNGLASYAISAVDLALWDLKGKLLQKPVYELLGGPQKDKIFCYATGFDIAWYKEIGFKASKLPLPYGPSDGLDGLRKNEALVAKTRELVGDDNELMLDCWLALDVEYTVRLAEVLRPYRLKWIEDYLLPEDYDGFAAVRERLPWQTLAAGEHWYLTAPFALAANRRLVDVFQPDICWAGGMTACVKICHIAEAAGISVIVHGGMNLPYGQHLTYAMPAIPWGERSDGVSSPGVPLEEMRHVPGAAVIKDGYLVPSDAPGFGMEVTMDWLEAAAAR